MAFTIVEHAPVSVKVISHTRVIKTHIFVTYRQFMVFTTFESQPLRNEIRVSKNFYSAESGRLHRERATCSEYKMQTPAASNLSKNMSRNSSKRCVFHRYSL